MEELFLKIVNMCISASWIIIAVIVLRFLLRKAPKYLRVIMWGIVGVRLVLPVSIESAVSLIPSAEVVPSQSFGISVPQVYTGIESFNSAVNETIESFSVERLSAVSATSADSASSASANVSLTGILAYVWLAGIVAMLVYFAVSFIRVRLRVKESIKSTECYYICDSISSAFVLGTLHPKIYVHSAISRNDLPYILTHERMHVKRMDNIWKPVGFVLLSVYWFNPLIWIAYVLLCRDIEYACDEAVIRENGEEYKKPYSLALINNSVSHRNVDRCPVAFGSTAVKSRVKGILSYRKPAFWVMLLSIILCVALVLCFLTDPKAAGVNPSANVSGDTTKVTVTEPTTPFTNTPATTVPAGDSRPSTTQTTTVSTSESASSSATETATTETESDKSDVDNTKTDTTTTTTTITTTTTTTAVSTTTSQTVVIDKNAFDKVIDGVYTAPNGGFQIDVPGWKLFNMYSVKLVPETYRMYGSTNCIIVNVHETLPRSQFENMNSSDFANMLNADIDSLEKRKIECASGSYTCYRAEIDDSADYGTICDLWMFQTENARYVLIFCQDIGESDMSPVAEKIMSSIRIYY